MLTCCFASKGSDRTPTSSTPSKPLTEPLAIGTSMASSRSITDSNHQHVSSTTLPSVINKNKHACFKARSVNENRSRRLRRSLTSITGSSFSQTQFQDHREVMLNDIVGNGISGVLHKWVNYGRGWRPRWFVLQDAVLSYYKIHGPDKIVLSEEDGQGSMIIGERSMRRISSHRSGRSRQCKPLGEIHLMVCTIRESESDEKRFSIYTGTKKRLHLRAESGEDRTAWLEALRAVKGMFPRVSNAELMAPTEKVVVSTGKLRQRLLEEGVSEAVIQDSENIMRNELAELQKHVVVLKQKQLKLTDTLRHLVTEKVDLENTVVEENQRQLKDQESSIRLTQGKYSDESGSDTSDEHDRHDGPEDSDDDGNAFFDTRDYLSTSSFRSNTSDFPKSPRDSDNGDALDNEDVTDPQIKSVGSDYPYVRRRKKLPDPVEKEKGVSLWSMIKDNIGKDLTKVCLPVYFNEPLSFLQKCYEELEYSYLLDRAYEYGKMGNCLMRTILVAAFAVSAYACTDGRTCKPFNPLLGETYEADYPDKGVRFLSEKVSHHPMIIACHCEGRGWKFWADSNVKSKFWGRSIQLDPVGVLTLEFDDGDVFQWSKVTTSIYNLILGKIYCDHYGTMRINGNRDYSCKIKFKEASIIGRNPHQVQGVVEDKNGKAVASVLGKWDESVHCVIHDDSRNKKGSDSFSKSQLVWKRSKPSEYPTRYNLTRFAITLNEITPGLKEKLPPTDSRLRPDQRFLENGEYDMANSEKLRLEQKQRQARQIQEKGWKPRWFAKDAGSGTYRYSGGYWESREKQNWENCPVIFGQLSADSNTGTSP